MALNFPNNPQTGDTYLAPNNQTYLYDGEKWIGFITPAGNIAQGITFVGDDSSGTRVSDGESFKIAGAGSITTAVSGDTITITGSASAQGITFVGDDSSGTRISDNETIKIAGAGTITTSMSGDTLTITGAASAQGITFVGDDSTGTRVSDGESFKIAGGTGLTSVISGDTITLDIDSTVATLTGSQELTNKTITFGSNTISGTAAQFNTGVVDTDFATLDGSEVLTNKTISTTSNTITGTVVTIVGDDSTGTAVNIGETFKIAGTQNVSTAVSGDTLTITGPNLSSYLTNSTLTVVGDDSTGVTLNSGETIKIAGSGSITTAVSGDTLTITGSASAQGITFVGDDSTGTRVSDGETIKITGTSNITTAVSGDTLTITGSKNIDVNSISSGDSSAIQINDAVNVSGLLTANAGLTINNNSNTWSFGSDGLLTVPANGIITAPNAQEFQLQAKAADSVLRNEINLDPNNGTYMSVWSEELSTSFSLGAGSWVTASWVNASGFGGAYFTGAENLQNFWTTGPGSFVDSVEVSINGGARGRAGYEGNNGGGSGVELSVDRIPVSSPTAITSLVFYYRTKNRIDIDYLNGQLLLNTQSMNINLETNSYINLKSTRANPVRIITNNNTHMWEFDSTGSLTLPGDLTIPGDIKSTSNTSIIVDGGVLIADVTVLSVDSFGAGVWRMFISSGAYPTLGAIVQVGDTATTAWNNSVAVTITSIVQDINAGTWALHTDQNLFTGWYENVDARRITINSTQVKTWTFGTDGTTLFPNQIIDGGTAPIELKSRSWSQLTYNNTSMTEAPNKNHSTTFYVEGGDALLEIFRWDGNSVLQHRQWTFSNDGSLTLPDTGTITFPDSTTQNTAARITIVGDDSTGVTLNAGETIKIAGAGSITTAVSGDTLTITGSKDINVNSITSSDSSAIQINDGVNVSGVLNAKTLITNTISSEDSTAIQVNDGLRISGDLTFSDNTVQTTAYVPADNLVKVSGTWTVTTGTNTYSFTVPADGTYTMWVKGNIANGIIIWNATVSVSNSNVAAIGTQYAWNYTGGGSPISLTGIPGQIRGSAGTISTDATYAGGTSNRFDFGISNTSGSSQTIYYGYTKIS